AREAAAVAEPRDRVLVGAARRDQIEMPVAVEVRGGEHAAAARRPEQRGAGERRSAEGPELARSRVERGPRAQHDELGAVACVEWRGEQVRDGDGRERARTTERAGRVAREQDEAS